MRNIFSKKQRLLSIVFEEHKIRFLEASIIEREISTVHQVFSIENSIVDEGGILDKKKWTELLKTQVKQYKIKAKSVHLVIPSSFIIVRQLTLPDVQEKDLKQMVQFEIGSTIHLPFEQPIIDLVKIKTKEPILNEEGELAAQVVLVAAPGQLIYPLVEGLQENRLKAKIIDIPALSLYRLFKQLHPQLKDEPILLSYVTKEGIDIHILDEGIVWFTRHIPMVITSFLSDLSVEEVLDAKTLLERIQKKENYQSYVFDLGNEIERAINFFQYTLNKRDKRMKGCWIATDLPFTDSFYQYLQERIDVTVHQLTCQPKQITVPMTNEQLLGYEVAAGMLFKEVRHGHGN
ncbi:pilus assembly protein PilM [Tepidibacillus infernus]|uniref:Pilus assembly protein PilM n=1 Tax=Tepidibacillus decaturensis TaxID=1413211 RepID=A0A135L2D1_9BACI|nr:pilus assembly protein PilM [Tepidibacillus decaturensis]KXG43049.1 hypothetical protein U473_02685 [Tepidibacillus decaturensis]